MRKRLELKHSQRRPLKKLLSREKLKKKELREKRRKEKPKLNKIN